MVFDLHGGVLPGEHGVLGVASGESDEVFRLGDVHRLAVNAGGDANHGPAGVAEGHGVYGILHGPVIGGAVLPHGDYSGAHVLSSVGVSYVEDDE